MICPLQVSVINTVDTSHEDMVVSIPVIYLFYFYVSSLKLMLALSCLSQTGLCIKSNTFLNYLNILQRSAACLSLCVAFRMTANLKTVLFFFSDFLNVKIHHLCVFNSETNRIEY